MYSMPDPVMAPLSITVAASIMVPGGSFVTHVYAG